MNSGLEDALKWSSENRQWNTGSLEEVDISNSIACAQISNISI